MTHAEGRAIPDIIGSGDPVDLLAFQADLLIAINPVILMHGGSVRARLFHDWLIDFIDPLDPLDPSRQEAQM